MTRTVGDVQIASTATVVRNPNGARAWVVARVQPDDGTSIYRPMALRTTAPGWVLTLPGNGETAYADLTAVLGAMAAWGIGALAGELERETA